MSKILKKIAKLRKKYPEYAYMKYKLANRNIADNWIVANLGNDMSGKNWWITTDHVHASEVVGSSKVDGKLIVELLNMFCNLKEQDEQR